MKNQRGTTRVFVVLATFLTVNLFVTSSASAQLDLPISETRPLVPAPEPPEDRVNDPDSNALNCEDVLEAFENYRRLSLENSEAMAVFTQDLSYRMLDWVDTLQPLVGREVSFSHEYFLPIATTADVSKEVSDMIFENGDQLNWRLEKIAEVLPQCLKGPTATEKPNKPKVSQ